jgi:NAD(P)H-dependent FMN reductase
MTAAPATRILAFAGSTRADSYNKKLVGLAAVGARIAGADVTVIDLRDYPLMCYDADQEATDGLPANARKLKQLFLAHGGLLIASPEYNSGISGVLKNTIDWVSRPESADDPPLACFAGKTAALLSASPGPMGGWRGLLQLRLLLGNIKVLVLPDQISVPHAHEAFHPDGTLRDARKQAAVEDLGALLARTISRLKT